MTKAATTAVKMLELLPEQFQERVVEKLCELIEEYCDEMKWGKLFERKKAALEKAARRARKEISAGRATIMNHNKL